MNDLYFLVHETSRRRAAERCMTAPNGYMVRFSEANRNAPQNAKMHAMIGEIAGQVEHIGRKWDADDFKRLLVDEFAEEMRLAGTPLHHDGRVIPSLDGRRIVQLGIQSREFTVREASAFIEFLYSFAAQRGVQLRE